MYLIIILIFLTGCIPIKQELEAIKTQNRLEQEDARAYQQRVNKDAERRAYEDIAKYERGELKYLGGTCGGSPQYDHLIYEGHQYYCRVIRNYLQQQRRDELERARREGQRQGTERYIQNKGY